MAGGAGAPAGPTRSARALPHDHATALETIAAFKARDSG
jgi:hypothetical protein